MKYLRERFKELKPYHSQHLTEGILLNANESPYAPPKAFVDYMKEKIEELSMNRYPDTDCLELSKAIAKAYHVAPQNIVCGVGSDELIDCVLSSTLEPERKVLMPAPSFSMYRQFTTLKSGCSLEVPLKADFSYDVEAIEQAIIKEQPSVIFLCNPNNPTGCILKRQEIERLLKVAEGLVIVDEAYEDFTEQDISAIGLINNYDHLIVLRTFSKAYALAGARVGYGIACEELINLLRTVLVPYNLSTFSQVAATWCMEHRKLFLENAKRIIGQRRYVEEGLQKLGYRTYPSEANFIWCELPKGMDEALRQHQIYIRKIQVQDKDYFRITIGKPSENEKLLKKLEELERQKGERDDEKR